MDANHHLLKDGRTLAYAEYGDPRGEPIFYAHGGPGSRLEGEMFHDQAAAHGFRLIATDRPGMGQSTFLADRILLDYPKDIAELADALGLDRFGVLGWSGGGAHTTVCCHALPKRLSLAISLAGYTNFAELAGAEKLLKNPLDQKSVKLSHDHPRMFRLLFDLMKLGVDHFPGAYYAALLKDMCPADKDIARDPAFREHFIQDQREALRQGGQGVARDAAVHYLDWGFRLKDLGFRLHVFHGAEDTMVPLEYARHLANNAPDCRLHVLEGEGHLFPMKRQELIFETARSELDRA
ncbi:MAG: alpha/beta hydrolase [Desulfovibrionaceae bacterium]|nr:alpha/beta hydrolase [Desulfovibrionaceae bacterium]